MKSTDSLDYIIETICRDDDEANAVHKALELALHHYQWQYQNASTKAFRDVNMTTDKALSIVMELLVSVGHDSLANEVDAALASDGNTLTKSKFITRAKASMKDTIIQTMSPERYSREFASLMVEAFKEHCEKYPLDEAPEDIERQFHEEDKFDELFQR